MLLLCHISVLSPGKGRRASGVLLTFSYSKVSILVQIIVLSQSLSDI